MYPLYVRIATKSFLLVLIFAMHWVVSNAQDVHFSQYFNNPLSVNPALAGEDAGRGRFILNYRSQWSSVTSNPYKTGAVSFDRSILRDELFGAIQIFNDKAGDSYMNFTQVNISLAPKVWISPTDYLKAGITGSWTQRSLNTTNLTWNSQFDGTTINQAIGSGEDVFQSRTDYFDCSVGLLWSHRMKNKNMITTGISAFHVVRPSYKLISEIENTNIRWTGFADFTWILKPSKVSLNPSALIMVQGPYREMAMGVVAKFSIGLSSKYTGYYIASRLFLGTFYRNNDAIVLYSGLEYKAQIQINLSYDINVSKMMAVAGSRGGMEISLKYLIPKRNIIKLK